jgi:FkbM family methyltransferase
MLSNLPRRAFEFARTTARKRRAERRIPDAEWRDICRRAEVPLDRVVLHEDLSLSILLSKTSLRLPKTVAGLDVLPAWRFLDEMDRNTHCSMTWDIGRDALRVVCDGAEYIAEGYEEVYILSELYLAGDYDFMLSGDGVVVDVGANVGFTSIFLASLNPRLRVEGFEPLKLNYEKALRNVAVNPGMEQRVRLFNYGLFSEDGSQTITSPVGHRGMSSIVFDRRESADTQVQVESVSMRRGSDVLREVGERNPGCRIAMKVDCEGSEYAIFQDLVDSGALSAVDFVVMEWHRLSNRPAAVDSLRELLLANGFHVYFRGRLQPTLQVGMAVAFRAPVSPVTSGN